MSRINTLASRILYEDNHYIALNKLCGELVQGDETGDEPLVDAVRSYIRIREQKPGEAFVHVAHRIDRPVSGVVLFAKTSKGLARINDLFRQQAVERTYWAIVEKLPPKEEDTVEGYLTRNTQQNKSHFSQSKRAGAQAARLSYRLVGGTTNYYMVEVKLLTGRHHQIRAVLAWLGCPVRGDLKYGARRSLPEGGIDLHARSLAFTHPVKNEPVRIVAPPPETPLWKIFLQTAGEPVKR